MLSALTTSMNAMTQASQLTFRLAQEIASPAQVPHQPAAQASTDPQDQTAKSQRQTETGQGRDRINQLVELKQNELHFMANAKTAGMLLDSSQELLKALD